MHNIGAYFQCYKNPTATFHALENFRKSYPDTTIILLSDNGYNYSKMASHFNAIYIHETENLSPSVGYGYRNPISSYTKFIDRIRKVLPLIKEEYFMLLEDDVLTKKQYTEEFKGTINGNCVNKIFAKTFKQIPFYTGPPMDRFFSGHGGSVYHKEQFSEALNNETVTSWLISNWLSLYLGETIDCDIFFSLLVYITGKSVHPLTQHKDGMQYYNSGHVIHQYKELYKVEPSAFIRSLYETV